MNKNKVKLLKKFPEIEEKGELLTIYTGMLNCISMSDVYKLLNNFNIKHLKFESIVNRIVYGFSEEESSAVNIFLDSYNKIDLLKGHSRKRAAKLLYRIQQTMGDAYKKHKIKLANKFLKNNYTSIRYYGYCIYDENSVDISKNILIKNWKNYEDYQCIEPLIEILNKEELFELFGNGEDIYDEYDFQSKIIRNKYYSKILDFIPNLINDIKENDPLSYVYIILYSDKILDPNTALNLYKKNPSNSLIRVFSKMKLWNVLEAIFKNIK